MLVAAALGWLGAVAILRYAGALSLVQVPNARSSHKTPTPSSGGVGIAIGGIAGGVLSAAGIGPSFWAILLASAIAGGLGLADDRFDLSARLRLVVQIVLVGSLVYAVPNFLGTADHILAWAAIALMVVAGVWWINLFNFMDGIDGLAASQAIFMLLAACGLAAFRFSAWDVAIWWWALAISAASASFLLVNWPPAKVFMGDAGSNFLAVAILGFALFCLAAGWVSLEVWCILGSLFVTDATVTLLRRIQRGEAWLSAHRSHAYQKLSRRWESHAKVTKLHIAVNISWVLPLSWLAHTQTNLAWPIAIFAYAPLIAGILYLGAGKPDNGTGQT